MTLQEYLQQRKITQQAFARSVGVTHATVSRWASGKLLPRLSAIGRIAQVTGGAVRAESFLGHAASNGTAGAGDAQGRVTKPAEAA